MSKINLTKYNLYVQKCWCLSSTGQRRDERRRDERRSHLPWIVVMIGAINHHRAAGHNYWRVVLQSVVNVENKLNQKYNLYVWKCWCLSSTGQRRDKRRRDERRSHLPWIVIGAINRHRAASHNYWRVVLQSAVNVENKLNQKYNLYVWKCWYLSGTGRRRDERRFHPPWIVVMIGAVNRHRAAGHDYWSIDL